MAALGFFLFAAVVLGHGSISVYLYNRINATGLRRTTVKRIEKGILAYLFITPVLMLAVDGRSIIRLATDIHAFYDLSTVSQIFSVLNVLFLVLLLPLWIVGRIEHWNQRQHLPNIQSQLVDVKQKLGDQLFKPTWLKTLARFPGNEINWIDVSIKRLPIHNLPQCWNNLRIAHLSDLHLTGWYDDRFYLEAIEQLNALKPDLCVLSGDLVDREHYVAKLRGILGDLTTPLGNFFILGNHDTRIMDAETIRRELLEMGWIDLGQGRHQVDVIARGGTLQLIGNELPWFNLADRNINHCDTPLRTTPNNLLRIGVCHTPDQWPWAIKNKCHLTLCGHTHGGQVRLPIIGPIIAPSYHGSRYASGIFQRDGNTMHVSRGLAGTQPLRLMCKPEVSLLELHAA
jgi:predicted MPP superfamily phosphohydrolase